MTQTINPEKLKAAPEHLEWALRQYPNESTVQALLHSLLPLIENAKAGRVLEPVDRGDILSGYSFGDGVYRPYTDPNVEDAYVAFRIEMRGGLTDKEDKEKHRHARMEAMWNATKTF
jgi:hypothetical protein